MMTTRRSGFTLVELLIVAVLGAVILGAVYETLVVQERTYAAAGLIMSDQEAIRTSLGILESELREVGAIGGAAIGQSDLASVQSGSITFRAQRKVGIVCTLDRGDNWLLVWTPGDPFATGDKVLIFLDDDDQRAADDAWDTTFVDNVSTGNNSYCANHWDNMPQQILKVGLGVVGSGLTSLAEVQEGAMIRGYEWVTYELRSFAEMGWTLTRVEGDVVKPLVGGLAPPGEGLQFDYFAADGSATTDPEQVGRIDITVRTDPPGSRVEPAELSTTLHLRNN